MYTYRVINPVIHEAELEYEEQRKLRLGYESAYSSVLRLFGVPIYNLVKGYRKDFDYELQRAGIATIEAQEARGIPWDHARLTTMLEVEKVLYEQYKTSYLIIVCLLGPGIFDKVEDVYGYRGKIVRKDESSLKPLIERIKNAVVDDKERMSIFYTPSVEGTEDMVVDDDEQTLTPSGLNVEGMGDVVVDDHEQTSTPIALGVEGMEDVVVDDNK